MANCIRCGRELTTGEGIGSMCLDCRNKIKPVQEFIPFYQQGWECPKCGRVYSPTTVMCFYCRNFDGRESEDLDRILKEEGVIK